ncbi:MAG: alpha/beta fold hydrolase [Deltaproteobacteria bacterium]|nr:alpha/beta fold hydrolase [Deltaproteobacteria bacterium]
MTEVMVSKTEMQTVGDVPVEIFWILTEDGAEIAVSHIQTEHPVVAVNSVILLHGTYSKRNFWLSPKGVGLGSFLAESGFDVWIPELRGHGLSPKNENFSDITAEQQIRYDIPAIQQYVHSRSGTGQSWVGHSFGGVYILGALSCQWLDQNIMSHLITFGSQISKGESFLKIPGVAWACSLILKQLGYFPAPRLGLGPEVEAAAAMIEVIGWKKFLGKWTNSKGFCYWDGMGRIHIPVDAFAGAADKNDSPEGCRTMFDSIGSKNKTFTILGKKDGFLVDYDHTGMIVSKESKEEIWPMVARLLQR